MKRYQVYEKPSNNSAKPSIDKKATKKKPFVKKKKIFAPPKCRLLVEDDIDEKIIDDGIVEPCSVCGRFKYVPSVTTKKGFCNSTHGEY